MPLALTILLLSSLASQAFGAPLKDPALASELCAIALTNRPIDQLQARSTCEIIATKPYPKGSPVARAVIVRVPMVSNTADILMFELATAKPTQWQDLGEVAYQQDLRARGSRFGARRLATLDRFELRKSKLGPVLEVGMALEIDTDDSGGVIEARTHMTMFCHFGSELVCVQVLDRNSVAARGKVQDIKLYSWTRELALNASGDLVLGPQLGDCEPALLELAAGTHTIASLANRPLVRQYPRTSAGYPGATDDDVGVPELP